MMQTLLYHEIEVSNLVKQIIPILDSHRIKGDNGIIGVVGGSFEYTGAPYYAAISALKAGSDLSHVFCHVDASIPIKSYSPELIVHPGFDDNPQNLDLITKTKRWFKSMDTIAYGPGLGRHESTTEIFQAFLTESLKQDKPHVFDADGLWHLMKCNLDQLPLSSSKVILTPNKVEYERLSDCFSSDKVKKAKIEIEEDQGDIEKSKKDIILFPYIPPVFHKESELAQKLNIILVKKGIVDMITNGKSVYVIKNPGSLKRPGGIGDILTGVISALTAMIKKTEIKTKQILTNDDILMDACALSCYICRRAAQLAYDKYKYSLTAPDVISELATVMMEIYLLREATKDKIN